MLPSTLAGLVLFIALLTPGFVFDLRLERYISRASASQLREIVRVVTASLLCNAAALVIFVPIRLGFPSVTPSVTAWLQTGNLYWQKHAKLTLPWLAGLLTLSCLFALFFADSRVQNVIKSRKLIKKLFPNQIHQGSAWSYLEDLYVDLPEVHIYVGCLLSDGSYLSGPLHSMSPQVEENGDRDLILGQPLLFRQSGKNATVELKGVGFTVVSAARLIRLDVTHFPSKSLFPKASEPQKPSASHRNAGLVIDAPVPGKSWRRLDRRRGRLRSAR